MAGAGGTGGGEVARYVGRHGQSRVEGGVDQVFPTACPPHRPTRSTPASRAKEVANYTVPRRVAIVEALPLNAAGKDEAEVRAAVRPTD